MHIDEAELTDIPGWEIVRAGLHELNSGRLGECALLVLVAAPRLRSLGFEVPSRSLSATPEHTLYETLQVSHGAAAHSRYNSLLRRVASFASTLEQGFSRRERS